MKKIFTLAAAMMAAVSFVSAQEAGEACYVIGEVNQQGWDPAVGVEMTKVSDGVFSTTVNVRGWFGFAWALSAAGDWDEINACRLFPADGNSDITLTDGKAVIELSTEKSGGDAWTLGAESEGVKFTVDYNEMTLTVETSGEIVRDENIYLVGDVTGWGFEDDYALTQNGSIYTINNVTVAGGFKLANRGWSPNNVGAQPADEETGIAPMPVLGEAYLGWNDGGSGNLVIGGDDTASYVVNITLDLTDSNAPVVTISDAAGIDGIAADNNVAPVYYNLQGVVVANPANGLYIVKQGNSVSKVLVK